MEETLNAEKNMFDTTETHRKKTWLLSWPSPDSCFVLFCFFAMYFLSGPAGQTAFFLLFSAPKLWLKLS